MGRPPVPFIVAGLIATSAMLIGSRTHGQRIANQFEEQTRGASRAPARAGSDRNGVDTPTRRPNVPEPVSRPDSWPSAVESDSHVLSSIRKDPTSPLVPLALSDDEPAAGGEGVLPASAVEPTDDASAVTAAGYTEEIPAGGTTPLPETQAAAAPAPPGDALLAHAKPLQTAMVVARVGPEVVLESDLLTPSVVEWLEKVTPGLPPERVRELKLQVYRHLLTQHIESLIVYVDACRTIPEEHLPEIEEKVNRAFDEEQLSKMMESAGVANSMEYEQLLRSRGQSLEGIRKTFFQRALAQQWLQQALGDEVGGEIPHADLIAYYQEHLDDYEFPAKARFEQLTVRLGGGRTREEAWDHLASLGNRVLSGEPFADVAREASEGPTAASGGSFDWTSKGSLRSDVLDEAIFSLPVGKLSTILEDERALHIIRVTERIEAGRVSFLEAQVEIRDTLFEQRHKQAIEVYLARLRDRTPVWTIFDDEQSPGRGGQQAAAAASSRR